MRLDRNDESLTDLADGSITGDAWETWRAEHPNEAAEVEIARRVRVLMEQLAAMDVVVPAGLEARILARVHEDVTLLDLLDLGFGGFGYAFLEFLNTIFGAFPAPQSAPQSGEANA